MYTPSHSSRLSTMSRAHHNPFTPLRSAAGYATAVWEATANHIGASSQHNDPGDEQAEVRDAVTKDVSHHQNTQVLIGGERNLVAEPSFRSGLGCSH